MTDGLIRFTVDGRPVEVPDDGASLLEVLRDRLGQRSVKDGCSPQGQCGCCTVLIDGSPRVACVTPARRVTGREVTTPDGLEPSDRQAWADAFWATGASQCGFCTPGIIVRLSSLRAKGIAADDHAAVDRALQAHLCRCTGWRTIVEAWDTRHTPGSSDARSRDVDAANLRASIEGRTPQRLGPDIALGHGGFADDTSPADALVAVADGAGGWAVGETLTSARAAAGAVPGRRTTVASRPPLEVPPGEWAATMRTTWVEPAYLETDASWCRPGGAPASPLANGGAFGAKTTSEVGAVARRLADEHGRPVRVLLSREDAVRRGHKRPPVAGGATGDGTGVLRVVRTPGIAQAVSAVAPGLAVQEVDVPGPPTSTDPRAAGWAEAVVLLAGAAGHTAPVRSPSGAVAEAEMIDGRVRVRVACGDPLDEVILRSYCIGATHMALGWVTSEGIAVDDNGTVGDLTIRSFGVLRAVDTPPVAVEIDATGGPPVNGSDAVFAAVAAAVWIDQGCPQDWPTSRRA
jgi:xanthine dehydrogenase small subunit